MGLFDFLKRKKAEPAQKTEPQPAPVPRPAPAPKPDTPPRAETVPAAPVKKPEMPVPKKLELPVVEKSELSEHLKKRYIEFDLKWSDEKLAPYFDEAVEALQKDNHPGVVYWGGRTIQEMISLPQDTFRKRIDEVKPLENVHHMLIQYQLDLIRFTRWSPERLECVSEMTAALAGRDMTEEIDKAKVFNQNWIELQGKAGNYLRSMTDDERAAFEKEMCGIASRLDSCSASFNLALISGTLCNHMDSFSYTGVTSVHIEVGTGKKTVSQPPSKQDVRNYVVSMMSSIQPDALRLCLEGKDYSRDPTEQNKSYNDFLEDAGRKAGLL